MSLHRSALLIACLVATPVASAQGQGVQVGPDGVKLRGFGNIDADATIRRWASDEERRITTHLELQIDLLRQPCELTDAQVEKLRVLSKGIASRKVAAGSTQLKQFMVNSELIPGERGSAIDSGALDKLSITGARIDEREEEVVLLRTKFEQPLIDHPLWQGVLKASLSKTQFAAYEEYCRKRNTLFVDAAVNAALAELDARLFLTPAQRAQVGKLWRSQLLPQVTVSYPSNLEEAAKIAEPITEERLLIAPVLSAQQAVAFDAAKEAQNWHGISWAAR